jgi:hypothetical protein
MSRPSKRSWRLRLPPPFERPRQCFGRPLVGTFPRILAQVLDHSIVDLLMSALCSSTWPVAQLRWIIVSEQNDTAKKRLGRRHVPPNCVPTGNSTRIRLVRLCNAACVASRHLLTASLTSRGKDSFSAFLFFMLNKSDIIKRRLGPPFVLLVAALFKLPALGTFLLEEKRAGERTNESLTTTSKLKIGSPVACMVKTKTVV